MQFKVNLHKPNGTLSCPAMMEGVEVKAMACQIRRVIPQFRRRIWQKWHVHASDSRVSMASMPLAGVAGRTGPFCDSAVNPAPRGEQGSEQGGQRSDDRPNRSGTEAGAGDDAAHRLAGRAVSVTRVVAGRLFSTSRPRPRWHRVIAGGWSRRHRAPGRRRRHGSSRTDRSRSPCRPLLPCHGNCRGDAWRSWARSELGEHAGHLPDRGARRVHRR